MALGARIYGNGASASSRCAVAVSRRWTHSGRKHDDNSHVPGQRSRFSQDDVDTILRERTAGKTFLEIATMLTRNAASVRCAFYRAVRKTGNQDHLIRTKKSFNAREIETMSELRRANRTWKDIGALLGRSAAVARNAYQHHTLDQDSTNYMHLGAFWDPDAVKDLIHMRDSLQMSWKAITKASGKSAGSLRERYYREKSDKVSGPQRWTTKQDELLIRLREKPLTWKMIKQEFPTRSINACRDRFGRIYASRTQSRPSLRLWLWIAVVFLLAYLRYHFVPRAHYSEAPHDPL